MKHWVAGFALLIVCISFIACKGTSPFQKSPGDVVKAFYTAANEGRYSDAKALLSEGLKKIIDGDLGQANGGIKGACDDASKLGTITKVEILKQDIRGEGATVIATVFYKDGSKKNDDKTQLILENGSWKITNGGN